MKRCMPRSYPHAARPHRTHGQDIVVFFRRGVFDPEGQKLVTKPVAVAASWRKSGRMFNDIIVAFPYRLVTVSFGVDPLGVGMVIKLPTLLYRTILALGQQTKPSQIEESGERTIEEILVSIIHPVAQLVLRLIFSFFLLTHLIACLYNYVNLDKMSLLDETEISDGAEVPVDDQWAWYVIIQDPADNILQKWASSFYWALLASQGEGLDPYTREQLFFNVSIGIGGIIMNACIIGSVASLLAATDSQTAQMKQRADQMVKFLRQNKVTRTRTRS